MVAREIEPIYNSCIADIEPVYIRYISQHSQQHFCIEQIAVPLAGDEGRAPAFIFYSQRADG
ncbi:MAG: hypothetical protein HY659_00680 [Rhizobiales bacterium]|nr:hypothetical protein [Hyphomicrobiales bacterium]